MKASDRCKLVKEDRAQYEGQFGCSLAQGRRRRLMIWPFRFHSAPGIFLRSFFIILVLIFSGDAFPGRSQSDNKAARDDQIPAADPTGADRCLLCHPAEVKGYARSAMAHSLRRAGQEPDGEVNANGSKITMHWSPTGYWQRWENGGG
jgi:hypothetical protein